MNAARRARAPLALCAVLAAGLSAPAASQAKVTVLLNNEDESVSEIGTFTTANCRRGKGFFTASARGTGGLRLSMDVFRRRRVNTIRYGGGNQITIRGSDTWSTLNAPPNPPPGAGSIVFNRSGSRMGLGVTNAFNSGITTSLTLAGAVNCRYPKKKRRARRAAVAEAARSKTKIDDVSINPRDDGGSRFSGTVISSRESCHNNRKVFLFRKRGRTRNVRRDRRVGSDRGTPNGDGSDFKINFSGAGSYYAYVKRSRTCEKAFSRVVTAAPSED